MIKGENILDNRYLLIVDHKTCYDSEQIGYNCSFGMETLISVIYVIIYI